MSGQKRTEQNFLAFRAWAASRTDADFWKMVAQGRLNRGEICRKCNFGRSALLQNPCIKEVLRELEEQLRTRGILPAHTEERERHEDIGLRLGEPVLCTRNLYEWGLQNGSLARIKTIEDQPRPTHSPDGKLRGLALAWIRWDDGERRAVTEEMLDSLELSYAVTVHKAQGSQFERVMIPVYSARNLNRAMLYTAMPRARIQVVLVDDQEVARRAAEAAPYASHRQAAFAELMTEAAACS